MIQTSDLGLGLLRAMILSEDGSGKASEGSDDPTLS